jgi:hypothetical protein
VDNAWSLGLMWRLGNFIPGRPITGKSARKK